MLISRRSLLNGGLSFAVVAATNRPLSAHQTDAALNFLAIGDWGKFRVPGQGQVALALARAARKIDCRFVISTGDNFYGAGVEGVDDPLWQKAYEGVYRDPALMCPWYPVLGNHDHKGEPTAQIEYSSLSSRWSMPAPYYRRTEVIGGDTIAEFFFLDTTPLTGVYDFKWASLFSRDAERQSEWLALALSVSRAKWKIVVGHHPIFSGGPHLISEQLAGRIKPLLDRFGVAAYINGHDHNLQHIVVDRVNYLTCGSGCETREPRRTELTLFEAATLGFLHVRILPTAIEIEFTDTADRALHRATFL